MSIAVDLDARVRLLLEERNPATSEPRDFLGAWFDLSLVRNPAMHDELMRLWGEAGILGLPGDYRVDKDLAWKDLDR
ncbi:hypothetical protein MHAE_03795 [Mycobacterium haemophilum DSM 44634]|uniref:hypothetical protein n=1 Tax=Mycobacterium haemophilum TaxID=29311 RepID=UPI0006555118|nr:hypothetical protein [Mycobacterium haemophilum]AKN17567.1 hypothetical protein B586_14865 [Mycobacterium haemophilum DSM 44634]MCV7341713.1 hypothetical protein [Mycobacterium haemophilum DSM 44634]